MWAFLASDCMFFGTLIATYMVYKNRSLTGPFPREIFDVPYTSVSAFVLLLSSLTMVLALAAIQRGEERRCASGCRHGAAGLRLPGRPVLRVHDLLQRRLDAQQQPVRLDVLHADRVPRHPRVHRRLLAASLVAHSIRGKLHQEHSLLVEIAGLYWHFVDIVWILIFTLVYLIPE